MEVQPQGWFKRADDTIPLRESSTSFFAIRFSMAVEKSEEHQRECREFANDANHPKKFAKFAHSRSKADNLSSDFATAICASPRQRWSSPPARLR
jgi:hypothetical protein